VFFCYNVEMNMVEWLQTHYMDLVISMQRSSHHSDSLKSLNPYHLEGDVWSHTLLVLEKAKERGYDEATQFALLCHDIMKPACRRDNGDRTSFKGHEIYSAYKSLELSRAYGFNQEDQEKIFKLIAYHTCLLKKLKDDDCLSIIQRQHRGNPDLLLDLIPVTVADGLGRVMKEYSKQLYYLEDYLSGVVESLISKEEARGDKPLVNCMIGLPASGKSTYLKKEKIDSSNIICRDDICLEVLKSRNYGDIAHLSSKQKDEVSNLMMKKKNSLVDKKEDIYFDMINLVDRDRYMSLKGIPRNYWFKATIFVTDLPTILERNKSRGKEVPWSYIERQILRGALPLYDEFDEIEWVFNA